MKFKTFLITHLFLPAMVVIIFFAGCGSSTKHDEIQLANVPTKDEVGVKRLPEIIAPVKAPFETIEFVKPFFPADTLVLSLYKKKTNRHVIQQAIDELSIKGGGVVVVPEGTWTTGRIELKSNINLHLSENALLLFSGEIEDYLPVVFTRIEGVEVMSLGACIYANNAQNIALTGKGRLVGPAQGSVRERILTTDVIDNVINPKQPVAERIVDGKRQPWIFPPMFISPINCTKVYIEGISLSNTAFWNIVPVYCDNVIIRGITVNSVGIPRGDGIDVESSKNVLIEYCDLSSGDDCFTMKAGRGADGIRVNKPTENVVVRFCLASEGHGGITVGSETAGVIRNLYVHDCVFDDTGVGIRFKTRRPRGGGGENLTYERIRMNLRFTAIKWDMLGSSAHVGDLAQRLPARVLNSLTPFYRNIHIKDILIDKATHFVKVIGIPESPVTRLTIENVKANCTNFFYAADLRNSLLRNIELMANDSVIEMLDVHNLSLDNVQFKTNSSKVELGVFGPRSDSIQVLNCLNLPDTLILRN